MALNSYIDALKSGEDYMLRRLYTYASESEYTRHTSTKKEEWRMTLRVPSRVLIEYLECHDEPDPIHVDEKFEENPTAAFGVLEAKRHRERGVRFDMFLGLSKYVRQAFIDLIYETKLTDDERKQALAITYRFFDKFELGFCTEWVGHQESDLTRELQDTNRGVTNEKNRYQAIFQSVAESAYVVDRQMSIVEVNRALEIFFGISSNQLEGKKCHEVFNHEFCEKCPLQRVMEEGSSFSNMETVISVKGEKKTVLFSGSFLDDISGKYAGGIVIIQDISERKRAEEELRHSELWLWSIFDSLEEAVLVVTQDRILVNVNEAAVRMFGYAREELSNLSTEVLHVDHEHYLDFGRRIKEAFDQGKPAEFEFEARRKNGKIFPTEHTVSLLRNKQGEDLGIISVIRDNTERKQAQDALEKRTAELRTLVNAMSGRETRMADLKKVIRKLRAQVESAGLTPVADDPLKEEGAQIAD